MLTKLLTALKPKGKVSSKADPAILNIIDRLQYEVADDGRVVCSTCGGYCGQCGDDYSAESVEEFARRLKERRS